MFPEEMMEYACYPHQIAEMTVQIEEKRILLYTALAKMKIGEKEKRI